MYSKIGGVEVVFESIEEIRSQRECRVVIFVTSDAFLFYSVAIVLNLSHITLLFRI